MSRRVTGHAAATDAAPSPAVGVWVRLARCYGLVLREVRERGFGADLTLAQFDALAQLLRHPDGMTAGALSDALLVTAGNVTGLVDRLSQRGLVSRKADAKDGRVRLIRLTAKGRRLAAREVDRQETSLDGILGQLDGAEQQRLMRLLDSLRAVLEREAEDAHHGQDL